MQDSQFKPEELDELIRRTYKRLLELDEQLSEVKTSRGKIRLFDSISKMGALLIKFLQLRGVKFDTEGGETLAELLSRLAQENKNAEETQAPSP